MYKTKNILKFAVSMLFIVATFTACVKDSSFDTPQVACNDSDFNAIPNDKVLDMATVASFYTGATHEFSTSTDPEDAVYVMGYVTSSDLKGNFYKELFIQDNFENPTAALKLGIDLRSLYTKYPIGSKIAIKLNGLAIDNVRGELTIGEMVNGVFSEMRENIAAQKIIRSCETKTLVPVAINSANDITNSMLGQLVEFNNAQFDISVLGLTFVDPNDSYDTHRPILFCSDETVIKLETSSFAAYAENPLPSKKFDVKGILTRDYGDSFFVLKINSTNDIIQNDDPRCDPILLDCSGATTAGSNVVFYEDFENINDEADLIPLGWTNVNVNGGSHIWVDRSYGGNTYMQNGAYNTNENPLEAWLVTPAINLDSTTDEVFTFDVNVGYYRGAALSVYASTDFTGDVSTATWQLIQDVNLPTGPSNGYGSFQSAGNISVDCLDGDVYFAFQYKGGDGDVTTTFQVDNVKVTGN
ncbi:MAG TPA: hypothetical protein ENK67_04440 [Flavobacteriia bacterium]|nr:hypothetical protein [Flavobacteriia bacterium]